MILYNTEKTSKDFARRTKIRHRIYTFSVIGIITIFMFTFMGLYINNVNTIVNKTDHKSQAQQYAKNNVQSFLNLKMVRDANDFNNATNFQKVDQTIISETQAYYDKIWNRPAPSPDKKVRDAYTFVTADTNSINIFSFTQNIVDENKQGNKGLPDMHIYVSTSFTITVASNPTDGSSAISKTMYIELNYDLNGLYTFGKWASGSVPVLGSNTIKSIISQFWFDPNPNSHNNFPS